MKMTQATFSIYTNVIGLFIGTAITAVFCFPLDGPTSDTVLPSSHQAAVNSANVLGHDKCIECHKSEVDAWKQSSHHKLAFNQLTLGKGPEFAQAMGISGDLKSSMCADCHATRQATGVLEGVSCESCHGEAGPEQGGWFSIHSDYGLGDGSKDRTKESKAHYEQRGKDCRNKGMNRVSDVYEIATNCLSCHTVPNEKLVNAGHPTSKAFELVEWSQGEIRHNFQMDQAVNAESPSLWLDPHWNGEGRNSQNRTKSMYVIGQLADLEISLRNRAAASKGDYGTAANSRISGVQRKLKKLSQIPEVKQALDAVTVIDRKALRNFGPGDKKLYGDAATAVSDAAKAFATNHADGDIEWPDGSKLPDTVMGKPFG